jgi:hypothetical protein
MATKKRESNTGFRSGNLFCFNCGSYYHIVLPMPVSNYAKMLRQFDQQHKDCKKVWQEPKPDMSWGVERKAAFWFINGERGMSSEAMFAIFSSKIIKEIFPIEYSTNHPSDPSDFRRCHLLLEWVPEWRDKLQIMEGVSPVWKNLVENWDKLTEMLKEQMETGKPNGMYEFMKELGCHKGVD